MIWTWKLNLFFFHVSSPFLLGVYFMIVRSSEKKYSHFFGSVNLSSSCLMTLRYDGELAKALKPSILSNHSSTIPSASPKFGPACCGVGSGDESGVTEQERAIKNHPRHGEVHDRLQERLARCLPQCAKRWCEQLVRNVILLGQELGRDLSGRHGKITQPTVASCHQGLPS